MLSPAEVNRAYDELVRSEMRSNYFYEESGLILKRHRVTSFLTVFFASANLVAVLQKLPSEWSLLYYILPALTAIISAYSVTAQNQQKAIDAAELATQWSQITEIYRRAYLNNGTEEAPSTLLKADERARSASRTGNKFRISGRRLRKWFDHASEQEFSRCSV